MTFATQEESKFEGAPVQLFEFRYGTLGQKYLYTNADFEITHAGEVYEPIPIDQTEHDLRGKLDRQNLRVNLSNSAGISELFRGIPPSTPITLTIWEQHLTDPDVPNEALVSWMGRVVAHSRSELQLELTLEPVSSTLRRPGLRRHYQLGCGHVLYGSQCRASKAAATFPTTVLSIESLRVTLAGSWQNGFDDIDFVGGILEWQSSRGLELRTIVDAGAGTVTLNAIPFELVGGQAVDVVLGCPRSETGCSRLHNNILNYGGCPWIPLEGVAGTNPYN